MDPRTVEDRLREEYFGLMPDVRLAVDELEAEVRYLLIPVFESMESYERLTIKSRVKECESAIGALRRRQENASFDKARASHYSLRSLNDLAGVRILAFPKCLVLRVDALVRVRFSTWTSDPISAQRLARNLSLSSITATAKKARPSAPSCRSCPC
jgi:ppGpp synthetase/RelA/SpoT-type nucleotidyltranferase